MPAPPSLRTIATAAGVSPMTVSYALRNHPRISAATRARVRHWADVLGYRPDPTVDEAMRTLRARKVRTAAFQGVLAYFNLNPRRAEFSTDYAQGLLTGASARATALGYELAEVWLPDPPRQGRRERDALRARGVRGILVPPAPPDVQVSWDWSGFAAVAMTLSVSDLPLPRVVPNHAGNLLCLLRTLKRAGYRRMVLVTNPDQEVRTGHASRAWFEWFCRHEADMQPTVVMRPAERSGNRTPPWDLPRGTEVMLTHDVWLLHGLRNGAGPHGVPPGVDLALFGVARPGLSGIDPRPDAIGRTAVDLLVAQLARHEYGPMATPTTTLLDGVWVQGATTPRVTRALSTV